MTINLADNSPRDEYTVNQGATQQVFTVSFEFFSDADLNVYVDGTLQTLTTDYLTADNNDVNNREDHTSGTDGFIHLTDSITGGSGGTKVVITRSIDLERTSDFPSSGPFDVAALNTELDKTIAMIADAKDGFDRALKLADSDPDVSMDLPLQDNRKGKVLAFNSTTGAPEAGPNIGDVQSIANVTNDIATLADIEDGTDATDAIQTVAGISANVTTVAGVSSNVTTVAGISANVTTVAGDAADITTVAGDSADIQTLADISSDITTAAGISANITTVAGDSADIQSLAAKTTEIGLLGTADAIADMNTLATSAIVNDLDLLADVKADIETLGDVTADITTVAGQVSPTNNIATVAGDSANIGTVAGISADVTTVAGISANTTTVAGISSNVTTVAGISSNVTTVSNNQTDIATVAGISSNVSTVAGISANVTTVAGDTANIATVAGATTNIGTVATDIANVNSVGGSIANVNTVASNLADVNSFADTYFISATEPSSPTVGDLWFDTTNNIMKVYGSGGFVNAGSSVNGTANRETFAVGTSEGSYDGSTTVFPIEYDAGYIDVYLNGIKLDPDNDFTATNGTSVTLSSAAATGDIVDMVGYGTFELTDFSIGAANNVDLTGLADDQILRYNSTSGNFEAEDLPASDLVNDTTPQLGGNLDVNGNSIVSASNGDISITPNGTGNVVIDGLNHPQADGTAGQFLKTDGAGQLAFATVTQATGNELENLSEDTTPQLGGNLDVNGNEITSASNGDVTINPNGTGNIVLSSDVGVNEANPETRLHITDNTANDGPVIQLEGSGQNNANYLLGAINFKNNDTSGDGPTITGGIRHYSSSSTGSGGYFTFHTHDGSEGGEGSDAPERMRIGANGYVGIGATSPANPLHIATSAQPLIKFEDTDGDGDYALIGSGTNGNIYLYADHGNGAGSSQIQLHVDGSLKALFDANGTLFMDGEGGSNITVNAKAGSTKFWGNVNATSGSARDSHNVTSFTDHGAGDCTTTINNDMNNSSYSIAGINQYNNGPGFYCGPTMIKRQASAYTTGAARLIVANQNNSALDVQHLHIQAVGDLA